MRNIYVFTVDRRVKVKLLYKGLIKYWKHFWYLWSVTILFLYCYMKLPASARAWTSPSTQKLDARTDSQRRSDFRSLAYLREKVRKDGSVARSLGQCSVNLNSQLSDFRAFWPQSFIIAPRTLWYFYKNAWRPPNRTETCDGTHSFTCKPKTTRLHRRPDSLIKYSTQKWTQR